MIVTSSKMLCMLALQQCVLTLHKCVLSFCLHVQTSSNNQTACYSAFTPVDGLNTTAILGVPFLRSYFTTYTYNGTTCNPPQGVITNTGCTGQAQIGIAPATMAGGSSPALGPVAAAASSRGNVAAPADAPAPATVVLNG